MTQVHEINRIEQLAGYRLLWNSLLARTRNATFFQSLDWFEVYWKHFAAAHGQRLRVLIVEGDDEPIGILPLVVRTENTRAGRVRVLTYPLHDWGSFFGPIGPNPTATLWLGMQHIQRTERDWDLLDMRWVDQHGCDHGRTDRAMEMSGFTPKRQPWNQTAVVELDGTWNEYWQSRSKKWRENLRRDQRRLSRQGEVTYVRYRPEGAAHGDGDPRWDLYEACVEIARASWQGDSTTGDTLSHEGSEAFFRDAHQAAARAGCLDLNLLLVDGKPVAFIYNYHYHGRGYGLRMGFDPQWASAGPGRVLQRMMFEDSFERGDDYFDMGVGYLEGKRNWATSLATSYRVTHFPMSAPQAQFLRLKRWYVRHRHGADYLAGGKSVPQVA